MAGPIKFEQLFDLDPSQTQKAVDQVNVVRKAYKEAIAEIKAEAAAMHKTLSGKSVGTDADNKSIAALKTQIEELSGKYQKLKTQRDKAMGAAKKFAIQNRELKGSVEANEKAIDKLNKRLKENQQQTKKNNSVWTKMKSGMAGAVAVGTIMANVIRGAFRLMTNAIKDSVRVMAGFESGMAGVRAITKATDDEFIKLSRDAIRLGGSTIFTARQVSELQIAYGKLGFNTTEIVNATEATLELAAATDESLASAAKVAGGVLRAFKLDAIEMQRVVDVMAESFTSSALDVEKFRESMKFLAPVARKAGFTIEDTTAILAKLADTGLYGSLAGTSMRNILLKMSDASSSLGKQLGFTVDNMDSFLLAMTSLRDRGIDLADALELTDLRAVTAFSTLVDGIDGVDELRRKLMEAAGAAKQMADVRMDTLIGKTTILKSAWEGLVLQINESTGATTKFGGIVDWATRQVNKLKKAIMSEGDIAKQAAQEGAQAHINAVKQRFAEERVRRYDAAQEEIAILKKAMQEDESLRTKHNEKIKQIAKDFNDFQTEGLQGYLRKELETLEGRTRLAEKKHSDDIDRYNELIAMEQEVLENKGILNNESAIINQEEIKRLGAQLESYLSNKQAIGDIKEILGQMASQAMITGEGLEDLSDKAFKDWAEKEQLKVDAMLDGQKKEIAQRQLDYKIKKHDLDRFSIEYEGAYQNMLKDIGDIEYKYQKKNSEAKLAAMEEGLKKEVMAVYNSYAEIIKVVEDADIDTQTLIESRNREIKKIYADHYKALLDIEIKAGQDSIEEQQKLADLQQEVAETNAEIAAQEAISKRDFTKFTEKQNKDFLKRIEDEKTRLVAQAEMDRLRIALHILQQKNGIIFDQIEAERAMITTGMDKITRAEIESYIERLRAQQTFNDAQMQQVENQIKELQAQYANIGKDTEGSGGFSIWQKLFGIDPNDPDGANFISAVKKAAQETMQILEDTVDFEVDMADRAVEASRSRLDQLLQNLETEDERRREGYANNVSALEKAIAEEKVILARAEKDQKAALRRKRNIEAATQTINMVTATSEIIKSSSAYGAAAPFIAAGLIAAMWGLFLSAQSRAGSAIGYKEGVIDIDGPGTGTSDSIPARLSKGESVMTAEETAKWKPVFTAIRNNDPALAMMEMARITGQNDRMGSQLQKIQLDHNLDGIMSKYYGNRTTYDGGYRIEQRGRITRRIQQN